jgi:hypothetical protein
MKCDECMHKEICKYRNKYDKLVDEIFEFVNIHPEYEFIKLSVDCKFRIKEGEYKMKHDYKIVYFENFCNKCTHEKISEADEPCRECLNNPVNQNSHKPINFKKK